MKKRCSRSKALCEAQVDDLVVAEADTESAWEAPVTVVPDAEAMVRLPADLVARVAFLARLHHAKDPSEWIQAIVRERVGFEEAAYAGLKRAVAGQGA